MKRCSRCGDFKLRTDFHRGNGSDGLHAYCKGCNCAVFSAWYRRHHPDARSLSRPSAPEDAWAALGPIYRRRTKRGRMGVMSRLNRTASKIVAVLDHTGKLMSPADYALRPFSGRRSGYGGKCIYFIRPVMTAGLTVLFEGKT